MGICNRVDPGNGSTSGALAVINDDYFEFTVSALAGFVLDLESLEFKAQKGGPTDPRGWVMRTSVDSFAADVGTGVLTCDPYGSGCVTPDSFSVNLMGAAFQSLSTIDLRLYSYTPGAGFIENFGEINLFGDAVGDASPVPAPATLALFGLGLAGLGWSRRKKA